MKKRDLQIIFYILMILSLLLSLASRMNLLDSAYADTKSITPTNINVFVNDGIGANSSVGSYTTRNIEIGAVDYRYAQVTNINKNETTSEADVTFRFRYSDGQFNVPRNKQYALFFSAVNSLNAEPSVLVSTGGTEVSCFALSSTNGSSSRPFGHFTNFYCPIFQSYSDNLFINFTYHNFNVNMDSFYIGISSSISYIPLSDDSSISSQIGSMTKNQEETNKNLDEANKKLDETNKQLGDLNDNLTNDDTSGASSSASGFFNDFNDGDPGGLSDIITKPLVLINSLLTNSNSCSDLSFSILGKDVTLPSGCLIWSKVPSSVVTIYQTLICGFISYFILRKLFKDVDKLKNPNDSEVSTVDL